MNGEDRIYERRREEMVRRQLEARHISEPKVLAAMRKVPRHLFVSEALQHKAYEDYPLPIGEQQTISQPYIVAEMTQALELKGDEKVLEIGTGSGYQAVILAEIAFRVFTIERIYSLYVQARKRFDELRYHNIVARYGDGTKGWKEHAPYDAIIVTAGAPAVQKELVGQLAVGGRMVIPVGGQYTQDLIRITKDASGIRQVNLGGCRFVKLIGENAWQE
ncbi:MAG: protein-L-isoaspartate(D-aspartate) O-methyltransferase [Desulfobacterales bacterium]